MSTVYFGQRVKELRIEYKMTQTELGKKVGVVRSAVSSWERGTAKTVTPEHLFSLAKALFVSPEWLALGEGPKFPQKIDVNEQVMEYTIAIAGSYKQPVGKVVNFSMLVGLNQFYSYNYHECCDISTKNLERAIKILKDNEDLSSSLDQCIKENKISKEKAIEEFMRLGAIAWKQNKENDS
ncbi:helix-turn-helix domain-containing protein [Piscirickettsia litoralis]|uniref:HTH cro/C1-type domain-containing protein n=1 Tax=Piscirickettsia litoralis TaxID=1891921 RepID=A0ABX2ZXN4_9GAMM|nr:helix-turn-helix transcriptional regulator [Piscirickettsia litoralis]ODN41139.1 hypothetical protein BGC07_17855 [Piscirickettsia litoralis]